jgi:uncharacterized surface protein with fasciclin (FAS1) repeats
VIQEDPQLSDYEAGFTNRPELVELINGEDVVTAFAPTNAAIALVSNWDEIVADDEAFDSFVRSHMLTGAVTTDQLFTGTEPRQVATLGGEMVTIDPVARTINGASIVSADTSATNGLIHTIDQVLSVPTVTLASSTSTSTTTTG